MRDIVRSSEGGGGEEEESSHERAIMSGSEEEREEVCSVYRSRGSVSRCGECSSWLHESCAQSTDPFLWEYCLQKKQLRDRCKDSTDSIGLNDSSSEEGQGGSDTKTVYSARSPSNAQSPGTQYKTGSHLEAAPEEPFTIGGQGEKQARVNGS